MAVAWGRRSVLGGALVALATFAVAPAFAQGAASPEPSAAPPSALVERGPSTVMERGPASEAVTLTYGNRPITVFRGRIVGRTPEERARGARHRLDDLVADGLAGPVETRVDAGIGVVTVAGREAVTLLPVDVDTLGDETLERRLAAAADALRRALGEVTEARSPRRLLMDSARALGVTLVVLALALLLRRISARIAPRVAARLARGLARPFQRGTAGEALRSVERRTLALVRALGRLVLTVVSLVLAYEWLTFSLRQFPYTRPWGEALRGYVIATLLSLGASALGAIPGLFTVVIIVVATRFVARLATAVFRAMEAGRLTVPGVYPDTVQPTRRLVIALLWIFAIVVAYPYLPGSRTEAFKGVSVFVGLVISLGSSGLVNQVMSSFMITYARALHDGDYVQIGPVEGIVVHSGVLATKVLTRLNEEVTIPNAVVAASTITNFSRHAGEEGVFAPTSVTIGYDTPWRQVEAMLLQAAARTAGLKAVPPPRVLQTGLQDFYVEYTLWVALAEPQDRPFVLSDLRQKIQDAFNEHGVQIMSPHYWSDPAAPKVVPKDRWVVPPATPR